jgi:hypothetical protein
VKLRSFRAWTVSPLGVLKIIFRFWETKSLIKKLYIRIFSKKIGTNLIKIGAYLNFKYL